jgi:hypothetical protein
MMKRFIITTLSLGLLAAFQLHAGDDPATSAQPLAPYPPAPAKPCPTPYPTAVIADYVVGCMLSNGSSPEVLRKCACSLDFIAESIPYEEYEKVDTLLRLQQMPGGGRNAFFKSSNWAKNALARLREVQAESTLRCF